MLVNEASVCGHHTAVAEIVLSEVYGNCTQINAGCRYDSCQRLIDSLSDKLLPCILSQGVQCVCDFNAGWRVVIFHLFLFAARPRGDSCT